MVLRDRVPLLDSGDGVDPSRSADNHRSSPEPRHGGRLAFDALETRAVGLCTRPTHQTGGTDSSTGTRTESVTASPQTRPEVADSAKSLRSFC
jgi:hypothetical protein